MRFTDDSLTIVLIGDWNRYYLQPSWIAEKVYEGKEIELGVSGQGTDFNVTYRNQGISIEPSQRQVLFSSANVDVVTLERLVKCVNNFLREAITPALDAYGFNCDYVESDRTQFADVIDHMNDNEGIIGCGYEIKEAKVTRTLAKAGRILNLESVLEVSGFRLHFNEHYEGDVVKVPIDIKQIDDFLEESRALVKSFGYDLED